MYELNFVDYLDSRHELLRAADLIEWDQLHHQMSNHYSTLGRRGNPTLRNFANLLKACKRRESLELRVCR